MDLCYIHGYGTPSVRRNIYIRAMPHQPSQRKHEITLTTFSRPFYSSLLRIQPATSFELLQRQKFRTFHPFHTLHASAQVRHLPTQERTRRTALLLY